LSTYERQNILTKKTENNNCNTYEISKTTKPQQTNHKQENAELIGNYTHNFIDTTIQDTTNNPKMGTLIEQLGNSSGGKILDNKTKTNMENELNYNFGSVRIHTDNYATNLTKTLNANATCYGDDIYFGKNQYNPNTKEGTTLLKHELNHYQQQTQTGTKIIQNQSKHSTNKQKAASDEVSPNEISLDARGYVKPCADIIIEQLCGSRNINKIIDTVTPLRDHDEYVKSKNGEPYLVQLLVEELMDRSYEIQHINKKGKKKGSQEIINAGAALAELLGISLKKHENHTSQVVAIVEALQKKVDKTKSRGKKQ